LNYKTHHVAALIGAELWLLHTHQPVLSWQAAAALLGAYLAGPIADMDHPQSEVGRKVWPLAVVMNALGIRHRTFTHSLLFLAGLWAALQLLPIPEVVRWAIWIGYATHPLMDLLNPQGVELFWPLRVRVRLLPEILAIPVDSIAETLLRGVMTAVSYVLLFLYVHPAVDHLPLVGPVVSEVAEVILQMMPAAIQTWVR